MSETPYPFIKRRIEEMFKAFKMQVHVDGAERGPTVTVYKLQLAAGVRLSRVKQLTENLAITLSVPSVRLVYPLPSGGIGLEVPNRKRDYVNLLELANSLPDTGMALPLFIGKDVAGNALTADLAKLPHLLIAGRTGTGKSVCMNALIASILLKRSPKEVEFVMIDPKMVEMTQYAEIAHLRQPVVTDMAEARDTLDELVQEMEARYYLMSHAKVRNLDEMNAIREYEGGRHPRIVVVIDEMADLMMTYGQQVEDSIVRLAQKGRAAGIHLIVATQRPTANVITGLIKANLPARIAFQVSASLDSRIVLDQKGAESLLGNGDLLFLNPRDGVVARGQGAFISDDDLITEVIYHCPKVEPPPALKPPKQPNPSREAARSWIPLAVTASLLIATLAFCPIFTPLVFGTAIAYFILRSLER
jgi:S-DNA-T family DNA segregation ATPase FtsK/SpoIIIE